MFNSTCPVMASGLVLSLRGLQAVRVHRVRAVQLPATEGLIASITFFNENRELIMHGNSLTDEDTPQGI